MTTTFPYHRFSGTHHEVGRQHGSALKTQIHAHLAKLEQRFGRQGFKLVQAEGAALGYRAEVRAASEGLDDEIRGLAEGAGISLGAAYLLQLRAEVFVDLVGRHGAEQECTTYAILPERAPGQRGFVGQNADLPEMYHEFMTVVRLSVEGEPEVLMVTPAGQISYIGINSAGLGVFGNYLHCAGWRVGFPRYLYTRIALLHGSVAEAERALRQLHRASSRNIIMLDAQGGAVDLENTPEAIVGIEPSRGYLVHANHYVDERLAPNERNPHAENSRIRHHRLATLIGAAESAVGPEEIATMLRDRSDEGDALSLHPEDELRELEHGDRNMSVTSVIAEPGRGELWIADGPPSRHRYRRFSFSDDAPAGEL